MRITIETAKRTISFGVTFKAMFSHRVKVKPARKPRCGRVRGHVNEFAQWDAMTNDGGSIGEFPDYMQPSRR